MVKLIKSQLEVLRDGVFQDLIAYCKQHNEDIKTSSDYLFFNPSSPLLTKIKDVINRLGTEQSYLTSVDETVDQIEIYKQGYGRNSLMDVYNHYMFELGKAKDKEIADLVSKEFKFISPWNPTKISNELLFESEQPDVKTYKELQERVYNKFIKEIRCE